MKEEPINVYPKCLKPNVCFIVFPRSQTQYCVFFSCSWVWIQERWSRSYRMSSSVCCSALWLRPRASCWTPWPNWTIRFTCAASARQVRLCSFVHDASLHLLDLSLVSSSHPSTDYLINRAELTLASIDKMQQSHAGYMRNMEGKGSVLSAVIDRCCQVWFHVSLSLSSQMPAVC